VDYATALLQQNRLLAVGLAGADLATPVPTCPGWTLRQLLRHVGRGDRWAAQIIREGDVDLDPRTVAGGRPPDDEEGALEWLRSGAAAVVDAVAAAGPQTQVATLVGTRPAQWWLRRRLHEATVHRADAAITRSVVPELAPEIAADGIDEWLELLVTRPDQDGTAPLDAGRTLTLRPTDPELAGSAWRLHGTASGIERTDSSVPSDLTVTGPAVDLFLTMVRRLPNARSRARVDGDPGIWEAWLTRTPL